MDPGLLEVAYADEGAGLRCRIDVQGRHATGAFLMRLAKDRHTHVNIARCLTEQRLYEQYTSLVALELLRPQDWAVDVGAHAGYFSLLFSSIVGELGQVFAFEPNLDTYLYLLGNVVIQKHPNIQAIPVALADRVGSATFFINLDNDGESALWDVSKFERFARTQRSPTSQPTALLTLDAVFGRLGARPVRLVKIDAEGAEQQILEGGKAFFDNFAPDAVICEINATALDQCAGSEDGIRGFFDARGYRAYVINLVAEGEFDLCGGRPWRLLGDGERIVTRAIYNLLFLRDGVTLPT